MYVVTFYSFKGGVGRSMSLVNVGVQLAQSGRKVLLVDFDLEAPGLPTFSLRKPENDIPGIVEYISQYIATGESPDVKDFVYESEHFENGGEIWVMPVGKQDASYSHRLNSIDWRKLYFEREGYLFFEDLKKQWEESICPDYVLIDSRTGHSDVEGICTRQLPNAVCLLFFPNEQNLHGLKRIVANINVDNGLSQYKKIKVHFAVSNVPDLDDEDQILGRTMQKFKKELGYKKLAAEIHHYNSLSLLNQEIFSLSRPNSRLTKEYEELTSEITKHNLGDREAAIVFLKSAQRDIQDVVIDDDNPDSLKENIRDILKKFSLDGEVVFRVSLVFEQLGNRHDALSILLSDVIVKNYATATMYAARARLRHHLGFAGDAILDLNSMLDSDGADLEAFRLTIPIMDQLDPKIIDRIPHSRAFISLPMREQLFLAFQLDENENQLKASAAIMRQLRNKRAVAGDVTLDVLAHKLVMASVGIGDFNTAIVILRPLCDAGDSQSIDNIFNLAMAVWGADKVPPLDLFAKVVELNESVQRPNFGANYAQCMAISYAILNDAVSAKSFLESSRRLVRRVASREFSAWSYTKVTQQVFLMHLDEIESFSNGGNVKPRFIVENANRDELF